MRSVKVILKEDMEHLGESGDVVDVKPGYARNYLLPQGLAYEASEANVQRLEEEKERAEQLAKRDYLEARRRASQIEGVTVEFEARASEEGKLFGSVTAADVADRLNDRDIDFEVDKKQVMLDEPIKQLGAFMVGIHLHSDVEIEVEVLVERGSE